MKILHLSFLLITAFFLTGCNKSSEEKVKQLDVKLLETKIGTVEKQKLITKIKKKEPPKVVKVKKKKPVPIPVSVKKENFRKVLVPIITEVFNQLQTQYISIQTDIAMNRNHEYIESLKKLYRAKNNEELLMALKPHPISIALAQSAIESAWLTSRFTKVANNIFGVWSFRKNEPRVEANATRGDKKIYLKKYKNFKSAIFDYYKNLGKNRAYKEFRKQRMLTEDPYELVVHLGSYSEKREVYTNLLKRVIEINQFDMYDIKTLP